MRYGWTDLIYTHISARVPGEPEHYLINPYGPLFDEMTASSMLKVDFDGNLLDERGSDYYLEVSCKIQVDVLSAGTGYKVPDEAAVRGLREYGLPQEIPRGTREWPGLLRMLDKADPSFRQ